MEKKCKKSIKKYKKCLKIPKSIKIPEKTAKRIKKGDNIVERGKFFK